MKRFTIHFAFALLAAFLAGCTPSNLSYTEALDRNASKLETESLRSDAVFLVEAANYNLLLTALSTKASQDGYARIVTDFATTALADHQRMGDDIRRLSKDKKIALPATMSSNYQEIMNELARTEQRYFDETYLRAVEQVHYNAIRLFEEAALNANESNIRAFAASKLDIMRSHERKAGELERELL